MQKEQRYRRFRKQMTSLTVAMIMIMVFVAGQVFVYDGKNVHANAGTLQEQNRFDNKYQVKVTLNKPFSKTIDDEEIEYEQINRILVSIKNCSNYMIAVDEKAFFSEYEDDSYEEELLITKYSYTGYKNLQKSEYSGFYLKPNDTIYLELEAEDYMDTSVESMLRLRYEVGTFVNDKGEYNAYSYTTNENSGEVTSLYVRYASPIHPPLKSLAFKQKNINIETGKTKKLALRKTPSEAKTNLRWKSSNPKVATVDQKGVVKAVTAGNTTITATSREYSKVKATCKVKVSWGLNLSSKMSNVKTKRYTITNGIFRFTYNVVTSGKIVTTISAHKTGTFSFKCGFSKASRTFRIPVKAGKKYKITVPMISFTASKCYIESGRWFAKFANKGVFSYSSYYYPRLLKWGQATVKSI